MYIYKVYVYVYIKGSIYICSCGNLRGIPEVQLQPIYAATFMNQHFWGKSVPCALIEPPYIAKQLSDCNLFECSAGSGSGKYIWSQHPNAGELLLPQCMQGG